MTTATDEISLPPAPVKAFTAKHTFRALPGFQWQDPDGNRHTFECFVEPRAALAKTRGETA